MGSMRDFIEFVKKTRFKRDMRYVCVRLICVPVFAAGTAATAVFMEKGAVSVLLICVFLAMIVCMFVQICRRYFLIVRNSERRFELMEKTNKSIRELGNDTDIETFLDKCLDYFSGAMEREYSAKILQTQAELDSMQSQINPHFLYNTLDSIRGQALELGSDEIADMIESLSVLFRYTISQRGDILTFEQELKKRRPLYKDSAQYRFENRFVIRKKIDDGDGRIYQCRMPKLTLQPIIENAIYHGLEKVVHGGFDRDRRLHDAVEACGEHKGQRRGHGR